MKLCFLTSFFLSISVVVTSSPASPLEDRAVNQWEAAGRGEEDSQNEGQVTDVEMPVDFGLLGALDSLDLPEMVEQVTADLNRRGPVADLDYIDQRVKDFRQQQQQQEQQQQQLDLPEQSSSAAESQLRQLIQSHDYDNSGNLGQRRLKRRVGAMTDFNGMMVSYPNYLRLRALQEKVIRLHKFIIYFQQRYPLDYLKRNQSYMKLFANYLALRPLLPRQYLTDEEIQNLSADSLLNFAANFTSYLEKRGGPSSRASPSTEELQDKGMKLDMILRQMEQQYSPEELDSAIPQWQELHSFQESLADVLPEEYFAQYGDSGEDDSGVSQPQKRAAMFNGMSVTAGEYARLMSMQRQALKLDVLMRKMVETMGVENLNKSEKWHKLVALRKSLQKVLPEGADMAGLTAKKKRSVTFNGVQVSYPTYLRLKSMQKKLAKLDEIMMGIRAAAPSEERLAKEPTWIKLTLLRNALAKKLLPDESQ